MRSGNKFNARQTKCRQGHSHASGREARRCNDLTLLERGGVISQLQQQPKFFFPLNGNVIKYPNGKRVVYTADFQYFEGDKNVVEDAKGHYRDDAWRLRRCFFLAFYPYLELREV